MSFPTAEWLMRRQCRQNSRTQPQNPTRKCMTGKFRVAQAGAEYTPRRPANPVHAVGVLCSAVLRLFVSGIVGAIASDDVQSSTSQAVLLPPSIS